MLLEEITDPVDCWFFFRGGGENYSENGVRSHVVISMSYLGHLAILMVSQRDHAENELLIVRQVFLCLFISLSFVNFNLLVFLLDTEQYCFFVGTTVLNC